MSRAADDGRVICFILSPAPRPSAPTADVPLPAVVCALTVGFVFGSEARLLHAHETAALRRRQCPGDDGLQSTRRLFARRVPAIGEAMIGFDASTWQSTMPFQCGIGVARKLNHVLRSAGSRSP